MGSAMRTLIIDTALNACTVLVADDASILAYATELMQRGHQERLGGLARGVLAEAGGEIDRIAVTVGPGSFTGLRVGLAFAKGFGLALDVPVVGLGVLDALAISGGAGLVAALIDARREQVYLGLFDNDIAVSMPMACALDEAEASIRAVFNGPVTLVGSGAPLIADRFEGVRVLPLAAPEPEALARLAARSEAAEAAPVYLRPPDATPPKPRAPRP